MARTRGRRQSNQPSTSGAFAKDGEFSDVRLESDGTSFNDQEMVGYGDHRRKFIGDEQPEGDEEIMQNVNAQRSDDSRSESTESRNDLSPTHDDSSSSNCITKKKPRSRDSLAFETLSQSHATSVWSAGTNRVLSQLLRPSQLSSNSTNSQNSSSRSLPSSASKNSRRKTYDLSQIRNSSAVSNDMCEEGIATPDSGSAEILLPTQASGPLKGLTCYVEVYSGQEDGSECVRFHLRELGAKVALRWSKQITHVIWKEGRQWTIDKARLQNCFLCNVSWVESCFVSRSRVDEKQFAVQFRNENGVAIIIGRKNKPRPNWLQLRNPQLGISMSADRALIRKPRRKRNVNESDDTPTRPPQTIKDSETNNDAVINFDSQQRKSNIMPLPSHVTADEIDIETPEQMAARLRELRQRVAILTAESPDAMDFSCSPTINTPLSERVAQKYRERGEQVPRFLMTELNEEEENSVGKASGTTSNGSKGLKTTNKSRRTKSGRRNSKQTSDFNETKSTSDSTDSVTSRKTRKESKSKGAENKSQNAKEAVDSTMQKSSPSSSQSTGKSSNLSSAVANSDDDSDVSDSNASEEFSYFNRPGRRVLVPESNDPDLPMENFDVANLTNTSPEVVLESFENIPASFENMSYSSPVRETPDAINKTCLRESPASPSLPLPGRTKFGQFAPVLKRNVDLSKGSKNSSKAEFDGAKTGEPNIVRPRLGSAPNMGLKASNVSQKKRRLLVETMYDSPADDMVAEKPCTSSSGIQNDSRISNREIRAASNRLSLLELAAPNLDPIDEDEDEQKENENDEGEVRAVKLNRVPSKKKSNVPYGKVGNQPKSSPVLYLCMTSLHRSEQDIAISIARKLGNCVIEDSVTHRTTHLVIGRPRRTMNLLLGLVRGCWILTLEWIIRSCESDVWLCEEDFEATGYFDSVQKCRLAPHITENLLTEFGPIFVAENVAPPQKEVWRLLRLCGASVIYAPRRAKIILGDYPKRNDDCEIVSELWLLDSITNQKVMPLEDYVL